MAKAINHGWIDTVGSPTLGDGEIGGAWKPWSGPEPDVVVAVIESSQGERRANDVRSYVSRDSFRDGREASAPKIALHHGQLDRIFTQESRSPTRDMGTAGDPSLADRPYGGLGDSELPGQLTKNARWEPRSGFLCAVKFWTLREAS